MTMLSRVANNIYWMARYLERAENTARLVNVNGHLLLDLPKGVRLGWEPIIAITHSHDLFFSLYDEASERNVVRFLVADVKNPDSILSALGRARENARTVRDIIPREAWEQVNELYLIAKNNSASVITHRHRFDNLRAIMLGVQTINGLLAGAMTHDEGYNFLRMGRNLERADMTTRIIDVRSATLLPEIGENSKPFDHLQWMSVLKSLTAYQMYRRETGLRVSRREVLKFLLQEDRFPRAFHHTLREIKNCLEDLPHNEKPLRVLRKLQRELLRAKPEELKQDKLHDFIDVLQLGLIKLNKSVAKTYF